MSVEKILEHLERDLKHRFEPITNLDKIWIITVDGQRVMMPNRKHRWNQRGHAKCALRQHLFNSNAYEVKNYHRDIKKAEDLWIQKHVKIMTLEDYYNPPLIEEKKKKSRFELLIDE